MVVHEASLAELAATAHDGGRSAPWCDPVEPRVLVVQLDEADPLPPPPPAVRTSPVVVVGVSALVGAAPSIPGASWCDALVASDDRGALDAIVATVAVAPLASTAFVQLLRGADARGVADGLLVESAVYSALQGGPELATWLAARAPRERPVEAGPRVLVERDGGVLRLVLHRPHVRNALDAPMRDELLAALDVARWDDSVETVEVTGAGRCYSSGGDLDEFGSFGDPATAHLVRTHASLAAVFHELRDRLVVRVHGPCRGSGIELPAFAGRVIAASGATFGLPELRLGLVPGAGGTVSLPARIGRHRTALLGLTGAAIDATTALAWGLVDEIADAPSGVTAGEEPQ